MSTPPNNIAQSRHSNRQARPGQYLTYETGWNTNQGNDQYPQQEDAHTYWMQRGSPEPSHGNYDMDNTMTYPTWTDYDSIGTSSETSSDSGNEQLDMQAYARLSETEAAKHIFWQHRTARRKWQRFTGKPVRKFRVVMKIYSKGKGK